MEAETRAYELVKEREGVIRALADALVKHETLDAAALQAVVNTATTPAAATTVPV